MKKEQTTFAKRIFELRKKNGLSQPELGKRIGTSGAIIGRYERGEMIPSIEVAQKLAMVFKVTLDFLIVERDIPDTLSNQDMLNRLKELDTLPVSERNTILHVFDSLIRDAKARQTYSVNG